MRISDWSSDVCSSDLLDAGCIRKAECDAEAAPWPALFYKACKEFADAAFSAPPCGSTKSLSRPGMPLADRTSDGRRSVGGYDMVDNRTSRPRPDSKQIGRASGRERGWQYG